jgi:eukaryotic-like serine/threonine-protein kinase
MSALEGRQRGGVVQLLITILRRGGCVIEERLLEVERLFHAAREGTPDDRARVLAAADPEVRREVESLLAQGENPLFNRPLADASSSPDATLTRLRAGAQLGPYTIEGVLGAGGMGEVYRARDTRLNRQVAIKISSRRFSERFEREARAIAALNHPNICTLYDFATSPEGFRYLVMEFVEGETLAARLKKGKLSIQQTIQYGVQIAQALAEAHAKGITHRDLKPGNIILSKLGVKVLDFGLAKSEQDETLTVANAVMGTPSYMAPEQLEGKPCDARTDIYSLGLILAEMATGKKGSMEGMSGPFSHVVERCLAKDPAERWQAASDVKAELEWAGKTPASEAEPRSRMRRPWSLIAVVFAALVAVGAVAMAIRTLWHPAPDSRTVSFEIPIPQGAFNPGVLTVSPDGHYLAFSARGAGGAPRSVWLHAVDSPETRVLASTEGIAVGPFWSPDSRFIAFSAADKLLKVDIEGGPPQTVCTCDAVGATWSKDGVILFPDASGRLMRVPAGGGEPEALSGATVDGPIRAPEFLPDGRHFLYKGGPGYGRLYVGSLDEKHPAQRGLVVTPFRAFYAPGPQTGKGHLLFLRDGTLFAQPFDERRVATAGEAVPVAQHVDSYQTAGYFGASANGVLVYRVSAATQDTQLTWFDRQGRALSAVGEPGSHLAISLSPDNTRAAFTRLESQTNPNSHLWLLDLARGTASRLTSGQGSVRYPVWSPDGNSIAYLLIRDGQDLVYRKPLGGGNEELLPTSGRATPLSWSPDGRVILYQSWGKSGMELWLLSLKGDHKPAPYLRTEFDDGSGSFSPDGHWVAYESNESGRNEIYMREVSSDGSTASGRLVSKDGGTKPHWRADGKELIYLGAGGNLMSVDVNTGPPFRAGTPNKLFQLPLGADVWDVTADAKRFLVAMPLSGTAPPPITVMLNWQAKLKTP